MEFMSPDDVATDPAGNVYVLHNNSEVKVFTGTGTYLTAFGRIGLGNGELNAPRGLAVAGNGNVFVADTYNHRIEIFKRVPSPAAARADNGG